MALSWPAAPSTGAPTQNTKATAVDQTRNIELVPDELTGQAIPASQISLPPYIRSDDSLRETIWSVQELRSLRANWDSYGAHAPTTAAINTATQLAVKLHYLALIWGPDSSTQPEAVAPLADGGVQIEWAAQTRTAEIQIGPTGSLGYLFVDRSTPETKYVEADDVPEQSLISRIIAFVLGA
jgi:hypothetical protein